MSAIGPGDRVEYVGRENNTCPNAGRHKGKGCGLRRGTIYTVSDIIAYGLDGAMARLAEITVPYVGVCLGALRKIESDPALAEITRQIRNCRPVREKEPTNG